MIQQQTILRVTDNSGAKLVKCIKVAKGFKRKYAKIGDIVTITIKQLRNKSKLTSKVFKGEIHKAVIIRQKKNTKKKDGSYYRFNENSVCILKKNKPIATRLIGPIPKLLKKKNCIKLITIGGGFV